MKTFILLVSLFIASYVLFSMVGKPFTPQPAPMQTIAVAPTKIPVAEPVELSIPAIGVDTRVEKVGKDDDGRMAVPEVASEAGWYSPSFKPGETGRAVIDGHLDTATSSAVFYRLSELKQGDRISVRDAQGNVWRFSVTGKEIFADSGFPIKKVFGNDTKPKLNLITCGGEFDRAARNYSNRVVIFSELVSR